MSRHLLAQMMVALFLLLTATGAVSAQAPNPADQVTAFLTTKGYTAIEIGNLATDQGQPRPDQAYVAMDAVSNTLDSQDIANQVIWGLYALRKYYPDAATLFSVPVYQRYGFFYSSTASTYDQYVKKTINSSSFWNEMRGRVRIYDFVKKAFISEKDFTAQNQTDKDQTNKNNTGNPNPVPTPVPGTPGKGANLRLEPSTTYLPADGKTNITLIATVLDKNYAPLSNQALNFAYEAPGEDAQELGLKLTDANGTARAQTKAPADVDSLLMRASTESLNGQISVLVGPLPQNSSDQATAVVKALTEQGYGDVEAELVTQTLATNEKLYIGIVQMRMKSKAMDREFYSQMSRGLGTVRTLFPTSNYLRVVLVYRKDRQDVAVVWNTQTAYWDQFVAGKLSEDDFWRFLQFDGACVIRNSQTCDPITDKNFMDKDFGGGGGGQEARISHGLESTVTQEAWGDQWHGQEFVILPGSYTDGFALPELSGNGTAVQVFQSPEFRTPLLEFRRGDNPDSLNKWRLAQGQYIFTVVGTSAPAAARMTYIEHIPR